MSLADRAIIENRGLATVMQNPNIDQRMASPVQITKNKATSSQSVSVGKAGPLS